MLNSKLKKMIETARTINEMQIRDEQFVSPKAFAFVDDKVIVTVIPEVKGVNVNDIANSFFRQIRAKIAVLTAEAWFVEPTPEDETTSPSEHPDRIEAVITIGGYDGHVEMHIDRMIRENNMVYLRPYHVPDADGGIAYTRCFEGVFDQHIGHA